MNAVNIRRLHPTDSLEDLTMMLRRAFAGLGRDGINCTCVDQTVETTRRRIDRGDCFVALKEGRVVGTVTLHAHDAAAPISWYRQRGVARLSQLAVEPCRQGTGVGHALVCAAEQWAEHRLHGDLALDTPEPAAHLHAFYEQHGFKACMQVQLPGRTYLSVVFNKTLRAARPQTTDQACAAWPYRHPAELALLAKARGARSGFECRHTRHG
jgi:predicted N-acetyltransferase YhbS